MPEPMESAALESVALLTRLLDERFDECKSKLSELWIRLGQEARGQKLEAAKSLLKACDDLAAILSKADQPIWLGPLRMQLREYSASNEKNNLAGSELLHLLVKVQPKIDAHKWEFRERQSEAIDFSGTFDELYRSSRAPELFKSLIEQLERLASSGEIDSLAAIKSLNRLIAILKRNVRDSYFGSSYSWRFAQVYARKLTVEVVESVPGLKQASKALKATLDELDKEMNQILEEGKTKLNVQLDSQLALPAAVQQKLIGPNDEVIDAEIVSRGGAEP